MGPDLVIREGDGLHQCSAEEKAHATLAESGPIAIAAQSQRTLQPYGAYPLFLVRYLPHRLKPEPHRFKPCKE